MTYAQSSEKFLVGGIVKEAETNAPMADCFVSIPSLDIWCVTGSDGHFVFPKIPIGKYIIMFSYMGYETHEYDIDINKPITNLDIWLSKTSLKLNNVTVTAKKGRSINTSSTIDRYAMDHLQSSSLKDVMQLLPGVLTSNSDLINNTSNFVGIRDLPVLQIGKDANSINSSGVGVYVDGMMVNHDASIMGTRASAFGQHIDRGLDFRTISTDNIESVEVIRGVASAEYGNISSGAIIVNRKKGYTPYEVRVKAMPDTKMMSLDKGYALGMDNGAINISVDYANAMKDIRTSKDAYNRGVFSMGYSNTFNREQTPMIFNAVVSGYISNSSSKTYVDNISKDERTILDDRNITLNINGSWLLNKEWITSVRYGVSSAITRMNTFRKYSTSTLGIPNPGSMESGEFLVEYTPDAYMDVIYNNSTAYYNDLKLIAELSKRYGDVYNKAMVGVEWNNSGNRGRGQYYEGERPFRFRPELLDDIPFMNKMSLFIEDKVVVPIGSTSLTVQAGARFSGIMTNLLNKNTTIDPRINIRYTFIKKEKSEFSLRGGWGIQTTMPGLRLLYPSAIYNDMPSFSWGGTSQNTAMSVWSTHVVGRSDLQNHNLKMQYSKNFEIGLDFYVANIQGSIVYYNEKMRNGYSYSNLPVIFQFREYASYSGTEPPVYMDAANGDKVLSVGGNAIPYKDVKIFDNTNKPDNGRSYDKWGLEYTFNVGQIRAIRTSIELRGAYMSLTTKNNQGLLLFDQDYANVKLPINGESVYNPFFPAYVGGKSMDIALNRKRFNSNVSFITHIPKLRLIASLTVQCVWIDRSQRIQHEGLYHINDNGDPVYGNYDKGSEGKTIYKDPDYYMNSDGALLPFDRGLYSDPVYGSAYRMYLQSAGSSNYFVENSFRPYFMANIRITKEIGKIIQISFYANNFTNSRPVMKLENTGSFVSVNTDIYYGAELKLKF